MTVPQLSPPNPQPPHPVTTQLADEVVDLVCTVEGPVTHTRVCQVLSIRATIPEITQTLDALVEHNVLVATPLPGNRITYQLPPSPEQQAAPETAAPKLRLPPAQKPNSVGAKQILTHLANVPAATSAEIAQAHRGDANRISTALAKLMRQARVAAVPDTTPRQYRITQMGRDSLQPGTDRRWGETRPKPATKEQQPEPAAAIRNLPEKLHVLRVMADAHNPRIAKVLRAVRDDLQSLSGAST